MECTGTAMPTFLSHECAISIVLIRHNLIGGFSGYSTSSCFIHSLIKDKIYERI